MSIRSTIFPIARRYGQPKLWTRDNASGYWTSCPACAPRSTLPEPTPQALSCDSQTEDDSAAAEVAVCVTEEADADVALDQLLRQSLVLVEVEIPHVALMDGVHAKSFEGQLSGLAKWMQPFTPLLCQAKQHCIEGPFRLLQAADLRHMHLMPAG